MNSGFVNLILFSPLKNFRFCYFKHIQKDKKNKTPFKQLIYYSSIVWIYIGCLWINVIQFLFMEQHLVFVHNTTDAIKVS